MVKRYTMLRCKPTPNGDFIRYADHVAILAECCESKPKTCNCPSGDGSPRHPCPAHPAQPGKIVVSPDYADKVEDVLGMSCGAWDMVDPKQIIKAVLEVAGIGAVIAGGDA